jgi:hypothetical protein
MPFPLPWFDNKVDPLLPQPQNIKPLLYAWDDYQTYDLLWYVPDSPGLWNFLYKHFGVNLPGNPPEIVPRQGENPRFYYYFTSITRPIGWTFFERFTPWDYAWAEEYSTKYFHLIKQYCGKDYYLFFKIDYNDTRSLKYLPNLPVIKYPSTDSYIEYFVCQKFSFLYNAPFAQTIVLTWLEYQGWEVSKRYRIIELHKGKNQITLLFPGFFCACSMVISGEKPVTDVERIIDNTNLGILYKNLDKLFEEINNLFGHAEEAQEEVPAINNQKWAYWATLIYANNNHWGNQININLTKNLGKPIFFTPVYSGIGLLIDINCHLWGDYLYSMYNNDIKATFPPGSPSLPIRTNLYKSIVGNKYFEYLLFTESEQEALNQQLEGFLITNGIAIPQNVVIDFLDAKKKLELQEDA